MTMKKILIIFGTRPEAIKLTPIIHALKKSSRFDVRVCVTGQHKEMLRQVLDIFDIVPDYHLEIMKKNQSLFDITTTNLSQLQDIIAVALPDLVIVQGDTTTAFTAALASFYARVSVAHVEAGLRTHDKYSPFPEEMNRTLVTRLADIHFAPTEQSKKNLMAEGISAERIFVTGNSAVDALLFVLNKVQSQTLSIDLPNILLVPNRIYILVTAHRREHFGPIFEGICGAIRTIADRNPDVAIIYPAHLNPNIQDPVYRILSAHDRIHLLEPLPYPTFVYLMNACTLILTDSGGIQEEAASLGKPTLVMRDKTERVEAVAAGAVELVGSNGAHIIARVEEVLRDMKAQSNFLVKENPYGDGQTAKKICAILSRII